MINIKYPFEKQKDLKDCGVCCLLMITRYYGGAVSKEYLRSLTHTDNSGVSALDLIEGAKKIGFDSYGVKGNIEDLQCSNTPCIAHIVFKKSYPHFVVIYQINHKKEYLLIADPNKNHVTKVTFNEFKKWSTNNYILLAPRKKIMYVKNNTKIRDLLYDFLLKNKNKISTIICLSLLITIIQILLSFKFKIVLDYIINYKAYNNLIIISLIFFSLLLIKELFNNKRNKLVNYLNHKLDKSMFLDVYSHILSLPYLYYKNRTTGEIISRINDLVNIRNVISKLIVTCIIDLLLMLGSIIVLCFISLKLAFISILTLLLILIVIAFFSRPLDDKITLAKIDNAIVSSHLVESIKGIETIKNQNIIPYSIKSFLLKYSRFNRTSWEYNNLFINFDFLKNLLIYISDLLVLIIGSYLVIDNKLTISTLITFITLNNYIFTPVDNFTDLILSFKDAKISFRRIRELYEVEEEKIINSKSRNIIGNITVEHLNYSYNNKDYMLKDISIDIKPGENVLIYGSSGCGKSTFAKLLTGELKANTNSIKYDAIDINRYKKADLRKDICYISSNETIFTDSIYNNIILDKDDESFDEMVKLCMVDEFVEKESMAYDSLIEEDGFNLSGGQKQRIILARSLIKNANIYILDEALNQVDIDKERNILINLFKRFPNKTFICISHRFNNSDLFDKKYRIENGVCYNDDL